MKFKIDDSRKFLVLSDCTQLEIEQLESSFSKKLENWYILKKKKPYWDCEIHFFSEKTQRVAIGLWGELKNFAKKFNFSLTIEGSEFLSDQNFKTEEKLL